MTAKRTLGEELIWKWTEVTGKYIGCQYCSLEAIEIFLRAWTNTQHSSLSEARRPAEDLSKKKIYGLSGLAHDHVFPKKSLRSILSSKHFDNRDALKDTLVRLALGCVVSNREHNILSHASHDDDSINPWLRYADQVALVKNDNWAPAYQQFIEAAGVRIHDYPVL